MINTIEPFSEFRNKEGKYYLLPFNFKSFLSNQELLINFSGDFLIVERGTADRIVKQEITVDDDIYPDLVSNFFISEKQYPPLLDVLATKYRTKKSFLDEFTALHIFVLTLRCNHACKYCQVSSVESRTPDSHDISCENLDYSVRKMFQTPARNITMEFQGGEPLLIFEKLKYAVEQAKTLNEIHNKNISYVLCSNSTLLTDEILEYMKVNNANQELKIY